jgi:hypothetical protein
MPSDAFLLQDGEEFGPFSPSQLKQLAAAGKIGPDDLIRKGEDGQPIPARQIAGLAEAFGATTSPPSKTTKSTDAAWLNEVLSEQAKPIEPSPRPPRIDSPRRSGFLDGQEGNADPSWLTTER